MFSVHSPLVLYVLCFTLRCARSATFNPATLFFKEVSIVGLSSFNMTPEQWRAEFEFVSAGTDVAGGGWVQPVVGAKFALAEGAGGGNDALHAVIAQPGGARGKIVIVP